MTAILFDDDYDYYAAEDQHRRNVERQRFNHSHPHDPFYKEDETDELETDNSLESAG